MPLFGGHVKVSTDDEVGRYQCAACGKRVDEVKRFNIKYESGPDDKTGIPYFFSGMIEICLECVAKDE